MKSYRSLTTLCCALALAHGATFAADPLPRVDPAKAGFSPAALQRIDRFFTDEIAKERIPGAVVAIARDGKLVYHKAMGFQDKQKALPMRTDTIFQLASMTKVMTVVGALTLLEEGKLPLNSRLSDYYPQFASMQVGIVDSSGQIKLEPAKRPITIQDLMRHTSGITYGGRGTTAIHKLWPVSSSLAAYGGTTDQFMETISKLPLLYQPATTWDYSLSTDALGAVIEKVTGKSLGAALEERVWSRIGMPDTAFDTLATRSARIAQLLPNDPLTGKPQSVRLIREQPKFECGGACAFSTAGDYLRFGQMLMNGGVIDGQRVLSSRTVRLMTSDHLGKDIKNNVAGTAAWGAGYGFGLGVAVRVEPGVAATNGSVGDYSWNGANGTSYWADPRERLVVVLMTASIGEVRSRYREQMAALVYGAIER